jgi:single-stranded DNA-binding protein
MIEVAFDGRLTSDAHDGAGNPMATFSVAVGRGDETQWLSVAVFDNLMSELPADLGKGERVYCEGRLTVASWEKDGVQRTTLRVAATRILALDRIGRRKRSRRKAEPGCVA